MADWLVADVGATHTRVGLATPDGLRAGTAATVRNAGHSGLAALLQAYLSQHPADPVAICAGVAGPVSNGTAQLTNLDWFIDSAALAAATGAPDVHLINDLQAQGYALDDLPPDSLTPLIPGTRHPDAPRLVLGLGTGSNIAVVHQIGETLFVPPAEAGHASLPHMPDAAGALIADLAKTHSHIPCEAALSGPGLTRIYASLTGQTRTPAQIIAAHQEGHADATRTLRLFARILGTQLGNLALIHMARGGLYLIGGTARAVAPYLVDLGFAAAFTFKGPYTSIMQDIPLDLITDDTAALRGCARYLRQNPRVPRP